MACRLSLHRTTPTLLAVSGLAVITDFHELLALDDHGGDRFSVTTPGEGGHLYGGLTFGVAARAAALTVGDDRAMYAASCQFIAAGAGGLALDIAVARVRDGRSLSLRRVSVTTADKLLFTCDCWFAPPGQGPDWQPDGPRDFPSEGTPMSPIATLGLAPLELVSARSPAEVDDMRVHPYWARSRHRLGDDPTLQAGAMAFLSDLMAIAPIRSAGGPPAEYATTLDHNLWLHRPFSLDEWVQVDEAVASIHGDRGLAIGTMHATDGTLIDDLAKRPSAPLTGPGAGGQGAPPLTSLPSGYRDTSYPSNARGGP